MKSPATASFPWWMGLSIGLMCASVFGQGAARGVTTKFEKDRTLTGEQVQSVLRLAGECGLAEPVEISIRHTQPLNKHFIMVRGKDHIEGRRFFYERLDIAYSKWDRVFRHDQKARQIGDFWVNPPYIVKLQFATFKVAGKAVTVQMSHEISLEVADKIIGDFVAKKVRFQQTPIESLDDVPLSEPSRLSYDEHSKEYEICFGSNWDHEVRFKLLGGDVVITMGPTYVVY